MNVTYHRRKPGEECPPVTREVSPSQALISLVKFELGFGGHVTELTSTRVSTQTQVMACTDLTTWEGTEAEMKRVYEVALNHAALMHFEKDKVISKATDAFMQLPERMRIPLFATTLLPMVMGEQTGMIALLAGYSIQDQEQVKKLVGMGVENALALLTLADETGVSVEEALREVG